LLAAAALSMALPLAASARDAKDGMAVSVVTVARGCVHTLVSAAGIFTARDEAQIRPDRDGMVVGEAFVEIGDTVAADQVVARLLSPAGAPAAGLAIRSPIAGTVVAVSATPGAYASPSAPDPLVRVVDPTSVQLQAEILASALPHIRPGLPARVHVIGLGDLDGTVVDVPSTIDAASQSGTAAIKVSEPRLKVGAFARADIDAGQACGLVVPLSALAAGPRGTTLEAAKDGTVDVRSVKVVSTQGGTAVVDGDIRDGDRVVARAGAFFRQGDHIRPVAAAAPQDAE
jgi:HlyD family secretion protein